MLLFISIETAPIFVKLISSRSPYDYLLEEHEHVFKMNNLERMNCMDTRKVDEMDDVDDVSKNGARGPNGPN